MTYGNSVRFAYMHSALRSSYCEFHSFPPWDDGTLSPIPKYVALRTDRDQAPKTLGLVTRERSVA